MVLPQRTRIQRYPAQNATGEYDFKNTNFSIIQVGTFGYIENTIFRLNLVSLVDLTPILYQKCILVVPTCIWPILVTKVDIDTDQRVLHTFIPNIKILIWFQVNDISNELQCPWIPVSNIRTV